MENKIIKEVKMKTFTKFYLMLRNTDGATMAEYAVVVALILVAAALIFTGLGAQIVAAVTKAIDAMKPAA
jgi:Flp pilus assembly pilin Flp